MRPITGSWAGATPLAQLEDSTFPSGTFLTFELPAQHRSDNNMIMIIPNWVVGYYDMRKYAMFISFRVPSGRYDRGVPDPFTYAVNIYYTDSPQQTFSRFTYLLVTLYDGEVYTNTTVGVVLRMYSSNYHGARVGVCRQMQQKETNCYDGLDNDCDGLTAILDPDCAAEARLYPLHPMVPL
eukprot:gene19492-26155_t